MKYVKLYEDVVDAFTKLSSTEWTSFIRNMVSFEEVNLNRFPPDINVEIRVTKKSNILLNYAVLQLDKPVFIYEVEDGYYGVYSGASYLGSSKAIIFKCDQIDGLLKCIDFIKSKI